MIMSVIIAWNVKIQDRPKFSTIYAVSRQPVLDCMHIFSHSPALAKFCRIDFILHADILYIFWFSDIF